MTSPRFIPHSEQEKSVEEAIKSAQTTYPCEHIAQDVIAHCPSCELAIAWGNIAKKDLDIQELREEVGALKKWIASEWVYPPILEWKSKPDECIIKGTVKDNQFGIIDGAKIVLTSKTSKTTFTDGTGFYAFTRLMPGIYNVTAKVSNNDIRVVKNIEIRESDIREINFEF